MTSAPSRDELDRLLAEHGSVDRAAHALGQPRSVVRDWYRGTVTPRSQGGEKPRVEVKGDNAVLVSDPAPDLGDMDALMRERGLDPADWDVDRAKLNEWDALAGEGQTIKLRQLTVHLKRKQPLHWLFPATDVKARPKPRHLRAVKHGSRLVAFLPDPHCPYEDPVLHGLLLEWLRTNQPDRIVCLGDLCDFPTISRHRDNPAWAAEAQACIQSGYEWLASVRDACPNARFDLIEGNHDERLRTELLTRAERMYGIKPADIPGQDGEYDALSMRRLLHLDRLSVGFIGPEREGDTYADAQLEISEQLVARHGWLTGNTAAQATLERLGTSVFIGHTHHQRMHHRSVYRGRVKVGEQVGVECGTLRLVRGGGGFARNADWQNGWATAQLWDDGFFHADFARFDGSSVVWRDQRFTDRRMRDAA